MKPRISKKFMKHTLMYVFILFIFLLNVECLQIKSKLTARTEFNSKLKAKADDDVDSNDIPHISIHLEDHDGDPLNFVKFNDERRDITIRYSNLEMRYNSEKRALMKLMSHQTAKLAELTELAKITTDMVDELAKK
jgi:hypothetical protein